MATKGVRGIVYFCPELRLYRYKCRNYDHEDGSLKLGDDADYKFDAEELEDMLVALLSSGDESKMAEARFVASMTGLGRLNPHKVVVFDTGDNKIEIKEPKDYWEAFDAEKMAKEASEASGSGG
jgi:hypothetical protein